MKNIILKTINYLNFFYKLISFTGHIIIYKYITHNCVSYVLVHINPKSTTAVK